MIKGKTINFEKKENRKNVKIWDSFEKRNSETNKQIVNSKMIIMENIRICHFEAMVARRYGNKIKIFPVLCGIY